MKKIKLTEKQTKDALDMFQGGESRKGIARQLAISEWAVKKLVKGQTQTYKYIGKRFGKLLVIDKVGIHKNGCPIVRCQCDCGGQTNVIVSNLTKKKSATVSCGCYNRDKNLSQNPWRTEFNAYLCNVIKKRNLSFKLTIQEFETICSSNCFYCQVSPSQKMDVGRGFKNGIDRTDNSIGYELSNCVPCCWTCNHMKGTLSQQEFLLHIRKVYKNTFIPI